ncbi:hypothetical protein E2C01_037595 [Portunus trituberculatus]|uniref:Uncharacterized protein n=1 Tax=Portunus trituberculatus TaxID=210409 RepID=A0A5B7FF06_PORTR|nr:hypothetical protein [Portunus trituberculatus]
MLTQDVSLLLGQYDLALLQVVRSIEGVACGRTRYSCPRPSRRHHHQQAAHSPSQAHHVQLRASTVMTRTHHNPSLIKCRGQLH